MSEPSEHPPLAPPPPTATLSGNETDDALHHRSISDEAPSPSPPPSSAAAGAAAAAAAKASAAKASASAFASKLAFGGRKFLSPLANVTGVGATGSAPAKETTPSSSVAAASSGDARSEASASPSPQKSGGAAAASAAAGAALVSSLAGANAAVSDAASAVTSSLGYLLTNVAATASAAVTTTPDSSSTTSSSSAPLDAAELEQLEAEFQQATAQQRMKVLEDLVQYRRADWNYLKAMHQGTNYWLNVALVRETQMLAHLGERAAIRRSVQFFYLGLGLGKVLSEVRHAHAVPLAGAQLLEELEYYFASATVQSMKLLVATSQPTLHVPLEKKENDGHGDPLVLEEPFRPTLYKWNQRPVFRWLVTPSIPFPLDYREVMLSLCDILAFVYSKLIEDNTCSENVFLFQAIVRFDERIKKLVIDPVRKEFSTVASTVMAEELAGVRKTFASGGSHRPGSNQSSSAPPAAGATTEASPLPVESLSQ